MRERTQAEIEAALTAYHGADGWDHNDRADMSYALAAADEVAPPDARIEALEAALRDARDRIPDWSTGSNAELLGRIKVILADAVSPATALAAAFAGAPRSTETELELVGSVETEVGEYPYSNRHSLRVLLGRAVSMIAPSLTQGQSMDEADRMLSSTIAAVRAALAAADALVSNTSRIEAALRIWYWGVNEETMKLLKRNGTYELMGKVLAV